ncbi:MAG: hypothetical protein RBR54_06120 [Sulfurimonas sp.]|jgi:hypothetical protein|nr:hypothetical protein [Sulfurimonas sp.]
MKRLFIYSLLFILSLNITSLHSADYETELVSDTQIKTMYATYHKSTPDDCSNYTSAFPNVTGATFSINPAPSVDQCDLPPETSFYTISLRLEQHNDRTCSAPEVVLNTSGQPSDYYRLPITTTSDLTYYCKYTCRTKTNDDCKALLDDQDAFFNPNTCSCMIPCTLPKDPKILIKPFCDLQECTDYKNSNLNTLSKEWINLSCSFCPGSNECSDGGLYGEQNPEYACPPLAENQETADVDTSQCNASYFQFSQPVTGLDGRNYSPWYYDNFQWDDCRDTCLYEITYCPKNQAYGWDEGSCVVPPDIGSDECSGDFYCVNTSVGDGDQKVCGKKCFCDDELVSDTPVSCIEDEDESQSDDNNNTDDPIEDDEPVEDDTPIEDANTTNPDYPADCTVNQVYNYDTQKCVDIEVDDTNNTNPINSNDDTNTTNTPSDTNSTYNPLDGIRQDLNTTNSILNSILQAIRDNNSSSSSSTGSAGTGESNTTQENNDTSENNESGSTMGDVEDMVKGIYNKKYSVFATECGAPTFDSSVVFMGNVIENPMIITHEKISPFISEIRVFVILSATLMGLLMIFRR